MARSYGTVANSQNIATGIGTNKTVLQYTAPANVSVAVTPKSLSFDGTNAAAAKVRVDLIRGTTGGTGTGVTPTAKGSNNPAGTVLGTAKENFSVEPTGGTVIWTDYLAPYGSFPLPVGEVVLAQNESLNLRTNAPASVNVAGNLAIEV